MIPLLKMMKYMIVVSFKTVALYKKRFSLLYPFPHSYAADPITEENQESPEEYMLPTEVAVDKHSSEGKGM